MLKKTKRDDGGQMMHSSVLGARGIAPFPTTAMAFLWHFLKRHRIQFIPIAFLMLFWSANEALYPYFIKEIINGVTQFQGDPSGIWSIVATPFIWLVSSFVIMEIAMRVMNIIMIYAYPAIRSDVRQSVTTYVKDHDLSYFLDMMSGNLSNKIHDLPKTIHAFLEELLETVLAIVFSFLFMVAVLWTASPIFSGLLLAWGVFHMGISFYFFPELSSKSKDHADVVSSLQGQTVDFISNILTVRLFAHTRHEMQRIKKAQKEEIALSVRAGWAYQKVNFIRGLGGLVFIFSTVYVLILGWQQGWVTTGDFSLVAMGIFRMLGLIWHLSMSIQGIFRNYGTIDSALEITRRPYHIVDRPEAPRLNIIKT